jgi:steroid 5-alpha reductase family enzyme
MHVSSSSTSTILAAVGLTAVTFGLLWRRQVRTRNATSVDAAWAIAIGTLGVGAAALGDGSAVQRSVAGLLALAWSARLASLLLRHRVLGDAREDGRYRAMREHWGERAQRHFFWFYQTQAVAALVFALPFWFLAAFAHDALLPVQYAGLAVVLAAQWAEATADRQLAAHRADPQQRGRTCRFGLWRYSRHPNYFFEWLSWCGIALVAAPAAGWWALLHPLVMFVLVRFVSGVPFTELQALKSRGDDYRRYQQETNAFVPGPPRLHPGGAA